MIEPMIPVDEDIDENTGEELGDSDKKLSMVDEALVAGTIANTNGLLVILAKLVAKGVFDRADLQSFSDSYSKPLDHGLEQCFRILRTLACGRRTLLGRGRLGGRFLACAGLSGILPRRFLGLRT